MKSFFTGLYYSFPVQLLLLHTRSNIILIGIWIFLWMILLGVLGSAFGVNYLFIAPEYLGKVGFWSFFLMGFGYGALTMSWNLTSYLLNAHLFPFLATLARPFTKFCLNNFLLPTLFAICLLCLHVQFEFQSEMASTYEVVENCFGFVAGLLTLILLISIYFTFTNKDILSFQKLRKTLPPNLAARTLSPGRPVDVEAIKSEKRQWRVDTYLSETLRTRIVRSVAHYDSSVLMSVFKQNHSNALLVQLVSLIVLVVLGMMIDRPSFRIPSGASIFLIASILIAITGAISYWFHRWKVTVLLLVFAGANYVTRFEIFNHKNKAYGLDYSVEKAAYSYEDLEDLCSQEHVAKDIDNTIQILDNWKVKNTKATGEKPKMILYAVSGGGLKSALWAMKVLQTADSQTQGEFTSHTVMMAGASGGMLGTAYYRELLLQEQLGDKVELYNDKHCKNIAKDLLNSVSFTIVTNDLFMPWIDFKKYNQTYQKDRGYIFEKQFNENVGFTLDKKVSDYRLAEQQAQVPLFFLTPSIVNDGRRMVISSQGVTYMMASPIALSRPEAVEIDAVDFNQLFKQQNSDSLSFLTALRMNATFPYILPNVYLPTEPTIEVMDAGFRDNFGLKSATRFIEVFQDWIRENTSGVVLVQVRGIDRQKEIVPSDNQGIIESVFNPLGIASQVIELQNYEHDTNIGFIYDLLGPENFEIIKFTYRPTREEAPISFRLTEREKLDIQQAIFQAENVRALERLGEVLE